MALFRKPSILQNKMKRLEREISLIESDINTLSRTIADPEFSGDMPRLRSQPPAEEPPAARVLDDIENLPAAEGGGQLRDSRTAVRTQAPYSRTVPAKTEPVIRGSLERRLPGTMEPRQEQVQSRIAAAIPGREPPVQERPGGTRMPVRDERFAGYLSSSMSALSPNRQQKRIQRNKALIMISFLGLLILLFLYHYLNS
jgi:hypothetical protein